jgi:hypothetical protein
MEFAFAVCFKTIDRSVKIDNIGGGSPVKF